MIEYTNECVNCEPWMGCLGDACPNRNVPHFYCDECGDEYTPDELLEIDGKWVCKECLFEQAKEKYKKVSDIL